MISENKVTEIFCMADDFCKFFDAITTKYTLKLTGKRKYYRNSTMSRVEVMLIMILFHDSSKCYFIEMVNDGLKNIAQMEYSRHKCFDNFIVNLLEGSRCLLPVSKEAVHQCTKDH